MFSTCSLKTISNSGKNFKVGNSLDELNLNRLSKYFGSFKNTFINEFDALNITNAGSCFIKTKSNSPIACQSNKLTR